MRAASSCVSTSAGASGVIDRSSAAYTITASGNGTSNGPTGSIWCCTSAASVLANKSRSVLSDTPSARSFPRFTSYDVVPGLIRNISLPSLALTALFAPAMFKIVAKNVSGSGAPYQYEFLSNVVPKIVTSMNSTRFLYGSSAPMFRMCPRPRNLSNDFVRCRIFLRVRASRDARRAIDRQSRFRRSPDRVARASARAPSRSRASLAPALIHHARFRSVRYHGVARASLEGEREAISAAKQGTVSCPGSDSGSARRRARERARGSNAPARARTVRDAGVELSSLTRAARATAIEDATRRR